MSTASLPGYPSPASHVHSPTYTAAPQADEYRLAHNARLRPNRSPREFVKQAKGGGVVLRLVGQDDHATVPVYGYSASVHGTLDINKREGITSVEVQIEGTLKLEEVAEGGSTNCKLFLNRSILWVKDRIYEAPCPSSLPFSLALPTTFSESDGGKTYPLPPSHESHLSGLPGFRARVDYTISVVAVKPNLLPHAVKSSLLKGGDWTISTPFEYLPRTCPSVPLPLPLVPIRGGVLETPQWKVFPSLVHANRGEDVMVKLYLPASRIFCMHQPIPFYVMFSSSAISLAAFMPLGPMVSMPSLKKQYTKIRLLRQTTVDVRNELILGTRTDIWRVDCIGEGAFKHAGDGPHWTAFSGEIYISPDVKVGGFKACGLSIKDFVVLNMTPPDPLKSPFKELRLVVPIRLATDSYTADGSGLTAYTGHYRPSSISSSDELEAAPELRYG